MNMTEKNGQPSMEEILASIRRIIAEEPANHPHNGELRGTPIMLKGDGVLEDAGEFDLPAIFRASPPPATERPTPLLGRLTDAIRSATTSQPEARNSEELQHAEAVAVGGGAAENGFAGLSSLKPAHPEPQNEHARSFNGLSPSQPVQPTSSTSGAFPAMASGGKSGDEPKRVMAPFKDTHFMRMAAPPSAAAVPDPVPSPAPAPVAPPPEPAVPMDFGAIVPGQIDRNSLINNQNPAPPAAQAAPMTMPPPLLQPSDPSQHALGTPSGGEETGTIEDTTADLLRPMLRQWLADNMPRMVEKALHIEIAESIKAPKKP